jgi:hypothetical protein
LSKRYGHYFNLLQVNFNLVRTKDVEISSDDAERIFGAAKIPGLCGKGPVVGMQFSGPQIGAVLLQVRASFGDTSATGKSFYVTAESNAAAKQADAFFSFAEMTMGV